jgi:hypothetical protein
MLRWSVRKFELSTAECPSVRSAAVAAIAPRTSRPPASPLLAVPRQLKPESSQGETGDRRIRQMP